MPQNSQKIVDAYIACRDNPHQTLLELIETVYDCLVPESYQLPNIRHQNLSQLSINLRHEHNGNTLLYNALSKEISFFIQQGLGSLDQINHLTPIDNPQIPSFSNPYLFIAEKLPDITQNLKTMISYIIEYSLQQQATLNHSDGIINPIKIDIEQRYRDNNTLLHIAAEKDDQNIAKQLIQAGADIAAPNDKNLSPIDCMSSILFIRCLPEITQRLEQYEQLPRNIERSFTKQGYSLNKLVCQKGSVSLLNKLHSYYQSISKRSLFANLWPYPNPLDAIDDQGCNVFHYAAFNHNPANDDDGYHAVIDRLYDITDSAALQQTNKQGKTPYDYAVKSDNYCALSSLEHYNAHKNLTTNSQQPNIELTSFNNSY